MKKISTITTIKLFVGFFLVASVFSSCSFAQEISTKVTLEGFLETVIGLLSWGWVILAVLAGKFMTNTVVYGSFLNLDAFFFDWWVLMKNVANFSLAFVLVYKVAESLIKNQSVGLLKTVKSVFFAGILVQSSWFLIGATLDVSNILVMSFGTLPSQIIQQDKGFEHDFSNTYHELLKKHIQLNINYPDGAVKVGDLVEKEDLTPDGIKSVVDSILPNHKSLSGPLLFLGVSILDIDAMPNHDQKNYNFSTFLVDLGINGLILLVFSISLLLLFIFNFLRIFVLWIIIPLSPILIIIKTLNISKLDSKMGGFLKIQSIMKLIFMPVFFVTYLSLMLIFIVSVKTILLGNGSSGSFHSEQSNITLSQEKDLSNGEGLHNSQISSDGFFNFQMIGVKNTFADLLLYLFVLVLLWKLVMMTFTTKTGFSFIDTTMKGLTDTAGKLAGSIGVVPVPGRGMIGMNAANQAWDNTLGSGNLAFVDQKQREQDETFQKLLTGTTSKEVAYNLAKTGTSDQIIASDQIKETIRKELDTKNGSRAITNSALAMSILKRYSGESFKDLSAVENYLKNKLNTKPTGSSHSYNQIIEGLGFDKNLKYIGSNAQSSSSSSAETDANSGESS